MAITPDKAKELALPDEKALQAIEAKIDAILVRQMRTGYFHGLNISKLIGDYGNCGLSRIMERYKAAGWAVQVIHDQRDGDFLSITPKP